MKYEGRIICSLFHKKYWHSFVTGEYRVKPSFNSVVYYQCSKCNKLRRRTLKNYSKFVEWSENLRIKK